MTERKIAIVAAAAGRHDAPLGHAGWECWGLNALWRMFNYTKFSRWYELHRRAFLSWEHGGDDNAHFQWLRSLRDLPVYVQRKRDWPDVLTAQLFPRQNIAALAPKFKNYHACSIDWMLAHAIYEGATEIRLYGVEQQHTAEPLSSRACIEFWSGFAVARGIHVSSADGSTFKLARLTYTRTAYALDPSWLPWEDQTNGSEMHRAAIALRRTIEHYNRRHHTAKAFSQKK